LEGGVGRNKGKKRALERPKYWGLRQGEFIALKRAIGKGKKTFNIARGFGRKGPAKLFAKPDNHKEINSTAFGWIWSKKRGLEEDLSDKT